MYMMEIDVPKNKSLLPFIDFKICEGGKKDGLFFGCNEMNLYEMLPCLKNEATDEAKEDSEDTLLDIDKLE